MLSPKRNPSTDSKHASPLPEISKKVVYKPFAQKLTFICKFCGGKSCKHENWNTYPESAIRGLNSDWVTSDILATQRPSSRIIREYDVIKSFTEQGINAIFNLQEPGEHPFCGDGIHPQSGFSYFPEEFYENGIYFFNFGWKDMTATSTDIILKILKQMSFSLMNGNKIAIHCHAGRGRTGLIIAAWLIYNSNFTAKEAVKHVRSRRKGAIQNKGQEEILFQLEKEIRESRIIFHLTPKFKLEDYLFHQKKLLPLSTTSEIRFIPKLVLSCLERFETLVSSSICSAQEVALAFYNPNDTSHFKNEWTITQEKALKSFKEQINHGRYEFSDVEDPRILAQALLDYFDNFAVPAIQNQFIESVNLQINNQQTKLTKRMKNQLFNQLDKKQFLLIESFVRFFSNLVKDDETTLLHFRKAILRLCISLVLERKKLDKLFLKRALIKEHSTEDKVTYLHVFILKWIENYSESFKESYMIATSPLKLRDKSVDERIIRADVRRGTYLNQLVGTKRDPTNLPICINPLRSLNVSPRGEENFQPQQNGPSSANSSPTRKINLITLALQDSPIPSPDLSPARSHTVAQRIKEEGQEDYSCPTSPLKLINLNSCETSKINFLGSDASPFHRESAQSGHIEKNYEAFFLKDQYQEQDQILEEERSEEADEDASPRTLNTEVSEVDKFNELLDAVAHLSKKKQQIILNKLLAQQSTK